MHDLNGASFLNARFSWDLSFSFAAGFSRSIAPFVTMYASLWSHGFDLYIEVLNLIFLLTEHLPRDQPFTSIHFFVINLDIV